MSRKKIGLPAGSLIYTGDKSQELKIEIIEYNVDLYIEKQITLEELLKYKKQKDSKLWINIIGINNISAVEEIGKKNNINSLVLEDILNVNQRPKIDDFKEYFFTVFKTFNYNFDLKRIEYDQISLIIFKDILICFQEKETNIFNPLKTRLKNGSFSKIKNHYSDFLSYAIIDVVVDNYFSALEDLNHTIDETYEIVINKPDASNIQLINLLKKDLIILRKAVWPLRENINKILKQEIELISKSSMIYFRDIYDHIIHTIDVIETSRDMVSSLMDIYLSSISNRMNEIIKVLTIFSTIFIPLTFIVGLYGMNFIYLPEFQWRYGYVFVWVIILLVAGSMLLFFRKKKWI